VPETVAYRRSNPLRGMRIVLGRPVIWAQAAIIICAYCGYKGLDNYSLYAVQVLGMDEVRGAALATWGAWVRPFAAVAAGLVADRFSAARSIGLTFGLLVVAYLALAIIAPNTAGLQLIYANLFVSFFAVFALRGIYFALLEENRTPAFVTGAAVGLVSLVGYTPEIFFAPITGRILDANPGLVGFQHYFLFLAAVAALGIAVVAALLWLRRAGTRALWPEPDPAQ
jgi:sugar phosphate permease